MGINDAGSNETTPSRSCVDSVFRRGNVLGIANGNRARTEMESIEQIHDNSKKVFLLGLQLPGT